jgi:hypothetical protein
MKLTLRAPSDLLKNQESDLVKLLRLGAGVNALESSSRLLVKVGPGPSEIDKLSRMHTVCTGLACLGELVRLLKDEKFLDRLIDLAAAGMPFTPIQVSVDEGRALLSPNHPDGGNALMKVRDKIAFHWDPHAFRELLKANAGGVLDLWAVSGDPLDRMFTASAHAIAQFTLAVPDDRSAEDFIGVFLHAVTVIGHVLEAAFLGLLVEAGAINPARYLVKESE